ncbi:uncharacterized protein LOC111702921 isoform X3 [Eurytemora carolleeae]|uniref:uncharacterized protein LOC111702921 isoform X3 n=1 Tax=Eurytemora carolleeae TaxID=1294199 RepID=UPI000C781E5C|nr:uncharacterized protein LOC111702921 isoform X3 [Eurytemora carolleeae]|eukprot:XP_023330499.1 uncharacterized protein LOC111702921 isoform X3 [Eurytemora affinis]
MINKFWVTMVASFLQLGIQVEGEGLLRPEPLANSLMAENLWHNLFIKDDGRTVYEYSSDKYTKDTIDQEIDSDALCQGLHKNSDNHHTSDVKKWLENFLQRVNLQIIESYLDPMEFQLLKKRQLKRNKRSIMKSEDGFQRRNSDLKINSKLGQNIQDSNQPTRSKKHNKRPRKSQRDIPVMMFGDPVNKSKTKRNNKPNTRPESDSYRLKFRKKNNAAPFSEPRKTAENSRINLAKYDELAVTLDKKFSDSPPSFGRAIESEPSRISKPKTKAIKHSKGLRESRRKTMSLRKNSVKPKKNFKTNRRQVSTISFGEEQNLPGIRELAQSIGRPTLTLGLSTNISVSMNGLATLQSVNVELYKGEDFQLVLAQIKLGPVRLTFTLQDRVAPNNGFADGLVAGTIIFKVYNTGQVEFLSFQRLNLTQIGKRDSVEFSESLVPPLATMVLRREIKNGLEN